MNSTFIIVLDATASMSDTLQRIRPQVIQLFRAIHRQRPDTRLRIVTVRTSPESVVVTTTTNADADLLIVEKNLSCLEAYGVTIAAGSPAAIADGILAAVQSEPDRHISMLVITDGPSQLRSEAFPAAPTLDALGESIAGRVRALYAVFPTEDPAARASYLPLLARVPKSTAFKLKQGDANKPALEEIAAQLATIL